MPEKDRQVFFFIAAGNYYLVVDADKAGSEGEVILQISGLPAQ